MERAKHAKRAKHALHVIGTAGHVDHGKTLLIEALTGINADRLPEEKRRGLTIDLGFAHFFDPEGKPVGVIDVPGHERFIRNMVAGAWSLDLALLTVAAGIPAYYLAVRRKLARGEQRKRQGGNLAC